jgi:multiple sugar transport system ATP-binding protein
MRQISLKSLGKSYGQHKVFANLDLDVGAGEIVVVFGGSGTGKTILLRLVAGVEDPSSGSIELGGQDMTDVPPEARNVGMAFQNFALFPHMSATENIAAPLRARHAADPAIRDGVARVAKLLKIEHVLSHAPRELSNGQKQRTALARALAAKPAILLLDDPLRNVDAKLRFEMRLELPRLLRQSGAAVLYVTQDYKEAMALADRIAVLSGGGIVQNATPAEIYKKPATLQVARLFGDPSINTFETVIDAGKASVSAQVSGVAVALSSMLRQQAGRKVVLGVRPEAVMLGKTGNGLTAQVTAVTPLNERIVLLLTLPDGSELLASAPSSATGLPAPGAKAGLSFNAAGTHVFDSETGRLIDG